MGHFLALLVKGFLLVKDLLAKLVKGFESAKGILLVKDFLLVKVFLLVKGCPRADVRVKAKVGSMVKGLFVRPKAVCRLLRRPRRSRWTDGRAGGLCPTLADGRWSNRGGHASRLFC